MKKTQLFVHPGCMKRPDCTIPLKDRGENSIYGPYQLYLEKLMEFHRKNTAPSIFLLYFSSDKLHECHIGFEPRTRDIVLEHVFDYNEGKGEFKMSKGGEKPRSLLPQEELAGFLKSQGLNEIDLVGEFGPCRYSYEGCVGWTWELLRPSFEVKGLPGLVYPTNPFTESIDPELRKMFAGTPPMVDEAIAQRVRMFRELYPHKQF